MFRPVVGEWESGELFEYIRELIEDWDIDSDYYEDDIVVYKNKPYKANQDTSNTDDEGNDYTEFDTEAWDRITQDEAYWTDIPVYFRYDTVSTNKVRKYAIQGLAIEGITKAIKTSSDLKFKQYDKILLNGENNTLKINQVELLEEENRDDLAFFHFADREEYIDKLITLK